MEHVRYEASDFTNGSTVLGKERFTCFNTEGVNPDGKPFTKQVQVARGQVQPLWFGLDIPQDTPADDEAVKALSACSRIIIRVGMERLAGSRSISS